MHQNCDQFHSLWTRMGLGLQCSQAMTMTDLSMGSMTLVHPFLEEEVLEEQQRDEPKQEEDGLVVTDEHPYVVSSS